MPQFKNILVGVDLSSGGQSFSGVLNPPGEEAVERGVQLAKRNNARLCFASFLDSGDTTERMIHDARTNDTNIFDEAHALLSQLVQRASQHGVSAEAKVLMGISWLRLIQEVLKSGCDLVIVGTRYEGLTDRVHYGSTAIKLLRKCPCPVWVTKPASGLPLSSVLVAHDLGPVGRKALDLAVGVAQQEDLQLYVIHGVEKLPPGDPTGYGVLAPDHEKAHQAVRDRILAELGSAELSRPPHIKIVNGKPESALLHLVAQNSIDLVIMGTVGRTGIRGLLTGNTAERLLRQLQCSLLAVKPDGFECPIDPE